MYNKEHTSVNVVIKSGAWYTISSFLSKGILFLTTPIFTRIMSPCELGQYSNFMTWTNLLSMIVSFNLYSSINNARLDYPGRLNAYCGTILLLGSLITLVSFSVVIYFMNFFVDFFSMSLAYVCIMFLYLLFQPALEIFQTYQRVSYQYKLSVIVSMIFTITSTIGAITCVLFMKNKFEGRVIGYTIPVLLLNIYLYFRIILNFKGIVYEFCVYAIRYSWPFIPHLLAMYVLSSSSLIMITKFCGNEYTAIYSVAYCCMALATTLLYSLNNAIAPWIYDKLKIQEYKQIKKITAPYFITFFIITEIAMLTAPEIIFFLGGRIYSEAQSLIVPMLTATIFQFAYCLYVNIEQYARQTWAIATGSILAALINIALNYLFLPQLGYIASSYIILAGYIVLFIIHYVFVRIIGYRKIYNDKIIICGLLLAIILQPLVAYLYKTTILRYCISFCLLIVIMTYGYHKLHIVAHQ